MLQPVEQDDSQQGLLQTTRRRKRRDIQPQRLLHSLSQQLLLGQQLDGQQSLTQGVQLEQAGAQLVQEGWQDSTQTGTRRHLVTGTSWQTLTLTCLEQVVGTQSVTVYGTLQWVVWGTMLQTVYGTFLWQVVGTISQTV